MQEWSHSCPNHGICPACSGTGIKSKDLQLHGVTSNASHTCPICLGKGKLHYHCPEPTRVQRPAQVIIQVPLGMNDMAVLRFTGGGNEQQLQQPREFGDLEVILKLENPDESIIIHAFDCTKTIEMNVSMATEVK